METEGGKQNVELWHHLQQVSQGTTRIAAHLHTQNRVDASHCDEPSVGGDWRNGKLESDANDAIHGRNGNDQKGVVWARTMDLVSSRRPASRYEKQDCNNRDYCCCASLLSLLLLLLLLLDALGSMQHALDPCRFGSIARFGSVVGVSRWSTTVEELMTMTSVFT
jgi:hypothetical protein